MGIRFPYLDLCCFYFPLKTGVKFFGFSSAVGCLLNATLSAWEIVYYTYYQETKKSVEEKEAFSDAIKELYIDVFLQLVQVITSVLLLVAVYQNKPKLIRPWLVTTVVIAVSEIIFQPSFPSRMTGAYHLYHTDLLKHIVFTFVMLVDDVYGWLVVFSYYGTNIPQTGSII